jgi:hypothetical protein
MAKTPSLNATSRPGVRCTEGESCPALPPGARAVSNERTQPITEATHGQLVGGGITGTSSYQGRSPVRKSAIGRRGAAMACSGNEGTPSRPRINGRASRLSASRRKAGRSVGISDGPAAKQ